MKNYFAILLFTMVMAILPTSCSKDIELPQSSLQVSKAELSFDTKGGSQELSVSSTAAWHFDDISVDWVAVTPSNANGSSKVTVTVLPNTGTERMVTLTLKSGNKTAQLSIKQAGTPVILTPYATILTEGKKVANKKSRDITEDWTIEGTVTNDVSGKNTPVSQYYFLQSGDQAIILTLGKGVQTQYSKGDVLKINLKGGKLSRYYDAVQVSPASVDMITKEGNKPLDPMVISAKDLVEKVKAGQLYGVLVKVSDVQFTSDVVAQGKMNTTTHTTSLSLSTKDGTNLQVQVSSKATFAGESVPNGNGYVIGNAVTYKDNVLVAPSLFTDIVFNNERVADAVQPTTGSTSGMVSYATILAEGKKVANKKSRDITEDWTIEGTVTNDGSGKNTPVSQYYFLQSGDQAIILTLDKNVQTQYSKGDVLKINLKGGKLSRYYDAVQVSPTSVDMITKEGNKPLDPMVISAKDLVEKVKAGQLYGVLVKVSDVQFTSDVVAQGKMNTTTHTTSLSLSTNDGTKLQVQVSNKATFAGESVPNGNGYVIGNAVTYKDNVLVAPSLFTDIVFNNERVADAVQPTTGSSTHGKISILTLLNNLDKLATNKGWTIEGIVTTDPDGNNRPFSNYYIIQSEGKAVALTSAKGKNLPQLKLGDKVQVNLEGASYNKSYSPIQLQVKSIDDVKVLESGLTVEPKVMSAKDFLSNGMSMLGVLVTISDVQIKNGFIEVGKKKKKKNKIFTIVSKDGQEFSGFISRNASFYGESAPNGSGSITGIVSAYNGKPQLVPRSMKDFVLNAKRF